MDQQQIADILAISFRRNVADFHFARDRFFAMSVSHPDAEFFNRASVQFRSSAADDLHFLGGLAASW